MTQGSKSTAATAPPAAPAPPPAPQAQPAITGVQLAMAFDGRLERKRVAPFYRLGLLLVALTMVLLPVVYVGIIAAVAWLVYLHATYDAAMLTVVRGSPRGLVLLGVIYVAPIAAGFILILFMLLPMFWRSQKRERPYWVDRREQPLLYAYVEKLCDAMRAPRPVRIDVIAAANASAHIDNGMFGIFRRRLVLTIGLPIPAALDLRQFTGVLAHELGHFAQGGSMRLGYVVHRINGWFARMAYGRSGVDDMLDSWINDEPHWSIMLIVLLSKLAVGTAKLILKCMAVLSHALSMHLSRQAEFDADHQAARIVGGEAMGDALQLMPVLGAAGDFAIGAAQKAWKKKILPDDLVELTTILQGNMPAELKASLEAAQLAQEANWFDTHPPLFKRVAALKKSKMRGVLRLDAPATCLFKEFDELSKIATIGVYRDVLGKRLQAEHLVPLSTIMTPKNSLAAKPRPISRR